MTDKEQIINQCKTCDVEPPAMKFKCPECEHNTENENFAKDINVPSKEQIMVDRVDISKCDSECFFSKCRGSRCAKWNVLKMKELEEQLTRKTQECEELKKECEEHKSNAESYCNSYQSSCKVNGEITHKMFKYKQALNDMEKELKELKRQYKLSCLDCEYKNTKASVDLYRKALEEIEDVSDDYNRTNKTSQYYRDGFDEILDIISKVKGE